MLTLSKKCPPNSQNLNLMDFAICNQLRDAVYKGKKEPYTANELRDKIQKAWDVLQMKGMRSAILAWNKCLSDVIAADSGSIKHLRL